MGFGIDGLEEGNSVAISFDAFFSWPIGHHLMSDIELYLLWLSLGWGSGTN